VRSAIIATQETILFEGDFLVGTKIIIGNDVSEQVYHVVQEVTYHTHKTLH